MQTHLFRLYSLIFLIGLGAGPLCLAENSEPHPLFTFFDNAGQKIPLKWKTASEWVWTAPPDTTQGSPALRAWILIPAGLTLETIQSLDSVVQQELKQSPLGGKGAKIAIDMKTRKAEVKLKTQSKKKRTIIDLTLIIEVPEGPPHLALSQSCLDQNISIAKAKGEGRFFFIGATCTEKGGTVDFTVSYSSDAELINPGVTLHKEKSYTWVQYQLTKPKTSIEKSHRFSTFELQETTDRSKTSKYVAFYKNPDRASRLSLIPGVGLSYVNYQETPANIKLTELGVIGSITLDYLLIPKVLDFGANAFVTLFPSSLTLTPAGNQAARFYGVNTRLGYRLPLGLGATEWRFLAGAYFMGMLVPGSTYGISSVGGPQVFISVTTQQKGKRAWSAFVKIAGLFNGSSSLDFSNRELAIGAAYQINSAQAKNPWMLTVDVASAKFGTANGALSANFSTYSLGITTHLF